MIKNAINCNYLIFKTINVHIEYVDNVAHEAGIRVKKYKNKKETKLST